MTSQSYFQPLYGKSDLGMTLEDPMAAGEQRVDLEEILIDCIPGDTHFWFEEVGGGVAEA